MGTERCTGGEQGAGSAASGEKSAAGGKRLRLFGKLLAWGVIAAVVGVLGMEVSSVLCYQASLSGLDDAIVGKGLPLDQVGGHVRGVAFRSEEEAAPGKKTRVVTYRWPSFVGTYRIAVTVDEKNTALRAGAGETSYASEGIGAAVASAVPAEQKVVPVEEGPKKKGLAEDFGQKVMLGARELSNRHTMKNQRLGSLARELIRQGVLIAARDEMGLLTRDELLGELPLVSEGVKSYPLEVDISAEADGETATTAHFVVHLIRQEPGGGEFKWTSSPMTVPLKPGLEDLTGPMETVSRGELIEGLKEAGFEPAGAGSNQELETDLKLSDDFAGQMDPVSQYAALRRLHAERRLKGETVENLGGLVRGYANLGNMIEYHWGPMSKVFKARALLYSERMQAKYGKNAQTLAHRAYAWTLVGNFKLGLEAAEGARDAGGEVPEWLPLMEAYCRHQPRVYDEAETEDPEELLLYLRMRLLVPDHDIDRSVAAISAMLQENPACSRAVERMYQTGRLGTSRIASEGGAHGNWRAIHSRLHEIPGLPEKARKFTEAHRIKEEMSSEEDEQSGRVDLLKQMRKEGLRSDTGGELSWSGLAELLGDLNFVQAVRSLEIDADWLGSPKEAVRVKVDYLMSMLEGHRLRNYLVRYKEDLAGLAGPMNELVKQNSRSMHEMQCLPLTTPATWAKQENYIPMMEDINAHWDKIYDDLIRTMGCPEEFMVKEAWDYLPEIAEHQPVVIARTLGKDEKFDEAKGLEWEQKYPDSAYLQLEIGKKHQSVWQLQSAMRCFKKSIELHPTLEAYYQLAHEYQRLNDLEKCQETLEESLDLEGYGLEKATTHNKLAELLMRQGKWHEALEHAEGAASSYSGWGLAAVSRCAEGLEDWEKAEAYSRQCAEGYPDDSGEGWYLWCIRTGRGNIRLAKLLAEKRWKDIFGFKHPDMRWGEAIYHLQEGHPERAAALLQETIDPRYQSPAQWVIAGLIEDKMGNPGERDRIFKGVLWIGDFHATSARLTNLFVRSMRDPQKLEWNSHSFLELVDAQSEYDVPYHYFCAGAFLAMRGEKELSRKYLECAATNYLVNSPPGLLANMLLREQGNPIGKSRLHVHPDEREDAILKMNLGYVARQEKRYEDSRKHLDAAVNQLPEFTAGYLERARLSLKEGKGAEAVKDYEEILRYNPESEKAHLYLAQVLCLCDSEEVRDGAKGLEHVKEAMRIRPGRHHWYLWLSAAAYAEKGDFERAIESMQDAIKQQPKDEDYPKMLAAYQKGERYYLPAAKLP